MLNGLDECWYANPVFGRIFCGNTKSVDTIGGSHFHKLKKHTGKPSITYLESVEEDGVGQIVEELVDGQGLCRGPIFLFLGAGTNGMNQGDSQ